LVQGYFDESERESGIFCIAGYIFAPPQKKKFVKEWSRVFGAYSGGLHMRDLAQRTRSFRGIGSAEQQRLVVEAVRIINGRMTAGFAVSCNAKEVKEIGPKWIKGFGHAYPLCCHLCMTSVGKFLRAFGSADRVAYVFESGHPREGEARTFMRQVVLNADVKESYRYGRDVFLPKSDAVPLQAADLLAWEWAKFRDETLERGIRPIRKSLLALLQNDPKRYSLSHVTGAPLKKFMGKIRDLGLLQLEEDHGGERGSSRRNSTPT
jgi:hypothetical protein